jgi:cysteinyl-tRNA synthetase
MVREANTAMDHGKFLDGSRGAFLDTLGRWDQTFAVLEDNDAAKLRQFGLLKGEQPAPEAGGEPVAVLVETLGEEDIEKLLSERETARRQRNFARADQIRDELQNGGVLVEDTKAGTRWKRI